MTRLERCPLLLDYAIGLSMQAMARGPFANRAIFTQYSDDDPHPRKRVVVVCGCGRRERCDERRLRYAGAAMSAEVVLIGGLYWWWELSRCRAMIEAVSQIVGQSDLPTTLVGVSFGGILAVTAVLGGARVDQVVAIATHFRGHLPRAGRTRAALLPDMPKLDVPMTTVAFDRDEIMPDPSDAAYPGARLETMAGRHPDVELALSRLARIV